MRYLLLVLTAVILSGCSAGEQAALDDYLERLGRALQAELQELSPEVRPPVLLSLIHI